MVFLCLRIPALPVPTAREAVRLRPAWPCCFAHPGVRHRGGPPSSSQAHPLAHGSPAPLSQSSSPVRAAVAPRAISASVPALKSQVDSMETVLMQHTQALKIVADMLIDIQVRRPGRGEGDPDVDGSGTGMGFGLASAAEIHRVWTWRRPATPPAPEPGAMPTARPLPLSRLRARWTA